MPTVQLTLSETTYSSLREAAERRSQPIEGLVEDALNAFLQPTTSAETGSGNGSSESAMGWRQAKIRAEAGAWRSLPPTIRRSYGDDFVAVHSGEVVDHDADRLTLYRRVRLRFGDIPVLITPASAASPREFQMHSPRVERAQ